MSPLASKVIDSGRLGYCTARFVLHPVLREVQPQGNRYPHLPLLHGQRDEHQAIGLLAEYAAVLVLDANRVLALLGQRRVVHNQYGVLGAYQSVSRLAQHLFQWGGGPGRS